ncbi:hypothetical protein [Pseudomonas sp. SID14000]|uniref:hypothetical protein n=1 Tax=Pseudomonas sp. SID14000 TaxID=1986221 RepID=UPI000B3BF917|nr:hypothetical protein [Pseudomonas sp. SID14000]
MRRAQGNTRSAPDGFLHLWNFAATKGSGLAGCLFNYVMSARQKDIVESALLEIADKQAQTDSPEGRPYDPELYAHFKHETWRFQKGFLLANFKAVVYGSFKLFRRNASEQMAIEINREYLQTEVAKVRFPA